SARRGCRGSRVRATRASPVRRRPGPRPRRGRSRPGPGSGWRPLAPARLGTGGRRRRRSRSLHRRPALLGVDGDGWDLDGPGGAPRQPGARLDRLVEILAVHEVVPAELLLGFGEWPVGRDRLAVPYPNRGRVRGWVGRVPGEVVALVLQELGVVHPLLHVFGLLLGGRAAPRRLIPVDQQDVLHAVLLPRDGRDGRLVHPNDER